MNLFQVYNKIKEIVIKDGDQEEIDSFRNIVSLDDMSKWFFFSEYCWVVLHTGFKYPQTKKIYDAFWNNGDLNFDAINNKRKHDAIKKMYDKLDYYFTHFKTSKNKLKYLESCVPFIGKKTKYHLIRNLGFLEYAKPDRHLERIASFFNYSDVQKFCQAISKENEEQPGIIDLYFWRFAIGHDNYLDLLKQLIKEKG